MQNLPFSNYPLAGEPLTITASRDCAPLVLDDDVTGLLVVLRIANRTGTQTIALSCRVQLADGTWVELSATTPVSADGTYTYLFGTSQSPITGITEAFKAPVARNTRLSIALTTADSVDVRVDVLPQRLGY